jgi:serine/threonine-protein kinase RsbW
VNERRISVPGQSVQLPVLTQFLQSFWSAAGLPPDEALSFELALEEVFINVAMHGAPEGCVPLVELRVALDDDTVTLTIEDDGSAFDPLLLPAPDVTASLNERGVGGMGVFLVRKMMDSIEYRRVGTRNQLRMAKYIARQVSRAPGR